jgi:hypothetical protein
MANNLANNPIGIDAVINKIQSKLYNGLSTLWEVELDGFPRCYDIVRERRKTIEHYLGNKEYVSLISHDRNKFFFTSNQDYVQNSNSTYDTVIDLYFIVDLGKCKPLLEHRGDEELRLDVVNLLSLIGDISPNMKITKGLENVFKGYFYNVTDDMQPYHSFKISLTINDFKLNKTNCNGN